MIIRVIIVVMKKDIRRYNIIVSLLSCCIVGF